jgi:hypothetical protein
MTAIGYTGGKKAIQMQSGPGKGDIQQVPINSLQRGESPRLGGEDIEHIQLLAACEGALPPILVDRQTMRVIDGMHRLRAAMLNGEKSIEVRFFDGSGDDAFVAAVRANIAHGLPLSLADRQAAAARIMASRPDRSDRSIASITGLAAGTVAAIRRESPADCDHVSARIGRDGRMRPLSTAVGRRIASDAIARDPGASLRQIARVAGISPTTVRDVRERLRRGDDPVPDRQNASKKTRDGTVSRGGDRPAGPTRGVRDRASLLNDLKKDPRCGSPSQAVPYCAGSNARPQAPADGRISLLPRHRIALIWSPKWHVAARTSGSSSPI